MSIQGGNYCCIQLRAALSQVYYWLISIAEVFFKYLNGSSTSQGHQDQQGQSQHEIDIPTVVFHDSNHTYNHTYESSNDVNPIMSLFQSKGLSKAVLNFLLPMATGLLLNQYKNLTLLEARLTVIALSIGFAATWDGMLLRGIYPRSASVMENFGVAVVIVAFYGLLSSFLPPALEWTSWLFCALSCLPLFLSLLPLKSAEETTHLNSNSQRPPV